MATVVASSLLSFFAPAAVPEAGAADPTVIAWVSDFGYDHPDMAFLASQVSGWNPDYVVSTGDNWQYANWPVEKGTEPTGTDRYDLVVGRRFCSFLKAATGPYCSSGQQSSVNRFFPVIGNHDYDDGPIANYDAYFGLPRHYDVRLGDVHYFAVNSEQSATFAAQKTWLQNALAASDAPWKIVALHQPVYGSSIGYGSVTEMQWDYAGWGADVVINGHAGLYERVTRNGIPYVTAGIGGGIGDNDYGRCKDQRVTGSVKCYGYLSTDIPGGDWNVMGAVKIQATTTNLTFDVRTVAQDGNVQLDSFSLSKGPLTVSTASLPNATSSTAYSQTLQATGGSGERSWSISAGSLPAGLSLNTSTGRISGTPTGTGTSNFTVRVTDEASGSATKSLSIQVNPAPLTIVTNALPGANEGAAYSTTLQASGGTGARTWSVSAGSLPAGLTLSTSGVISGTPTGAGTSNFTVRVQDAASASTTRSLSIATTARPGGSLVGVSPARALDTRITGPCLSGNGRELVITGSRGVPANASAVVLNVTATGAKAPGFLTVYPTGTTRPTASNLNYSAGQTIPNAVTAKVGTGGKITLYASGGCPNAVVDVVGYYAAGTPVAGGYGAVTPARALDTRITAPCVSGNGRELVITGSRGVPANASAVVLNVTATGAKAPGFLTVYPTGTTRPTASNLNYATGQTIPNAVTTKVGTGGKITLYASGGCPNAVVDVVGYYAGGTPSTGGFVPINPARALDTRITTPCVSGAGREHTIAPKGDVPADATAVVLNVTATGAKAPGFFTVYPTGTTRPTASNLNYSAGQTIPNAVTTKVGTGGKITLYASGGCPNAVVDVVGYVKG